MINCDKQKAKRTVNRDGVSTCDAQKKYYYYKMYCRAKIRRDKGGLWSA